MLPSSSGGAPLQESLGLVTLREQYRSVRRKLGEAKESKIQSEAAKVNLWELKKFAYDAEDLLRDIDALPPSSDATDDLRRKIDLVSSRYGEAESQMDRLALRAPEPSPPAAKKKRLATGCVPKERKIYGMDGNKNDLVKLLLSDANSRAEDLDGEYWLAKNKNVTILPIVGVGGVGKTTLAQHIFNDTEVRKHFELTAWIWMYDKSDRRALMRAVLESLTKKPCRMDPRDDDPKRQIEEEVMGKVFLIVLDDAWKGSQDLLPSLWEALSPAAEGSVVMITTRDYAVLQSGCENMQRTKPCMVPPLEEEDCMAMFLRHAFTKGDPKKHPDLVKIGKNLIDKAEGLPLLVKNIARKLKSEDDVKKQDEGVPKSDVVDLDRKEILESVDSSYRDLSPELKRCLEYCALFPRGYQYDRNRLIELWMAEDLIEAQGNKKPEEIGHDYFQELLYRSLFWHSWHDDQVITMPNSVLDFVQSIAGDEYAKIQEDVEWDSFPDVRYSSFIVTHPGKGIQCRPQKPNILRAFLVINITKRIAHLELPDDMLQKMEHLQALELSDSDIKELPESISYLKHLRYLGLNGTQISTLPRSICSLYNLQVLGLKSCKNLQNIPGNIGGLIKLRHLDLIEYHSSFCMPTGIGKLTNLQTLPSFKVGREDSEYSGIKELEYLDNLKGELCILGLCNVSAQDSELANLKRKEFLEKLTLSWSFDMNGSGFRQVSDNNNRHYLGTEINGNVVSLASGTCIKDDEHVLNSLKPHTNITSLTIESYRGVRFPDWIGGVSFTKMKYLKLENCIRCDRLPSLGLMPNLKFLSIICMPLIQNSSRFCRPKFEHDLENSIKKAFPFLEQLSFKDLPEWAEWSGVEEGDFPKLDALEVINCPKVEGLPYLKKLISLKMKDCGRLTRLPKFDSLKKLELKNCGQLTELPGFNCIEEIEMENCEGLATFPELPSLKSLQLYGCDKMTSLPTLKSLESLTVTYCKGLNSLSSNFPVLELLSLLTIPNLNEIPQITSLKTLEMENCGKVTSIPYLPDLENLQLCACDGLVGLHKFPSLLSLTLMYCNEIKSLPAITKLESLWIEDCKQLKCDYLGSGLMGISLDSLVIVNSNLCGFSEDVIQQLQSTSNFFVDEHTLAKWQKAEDTVS